MNILLLTTGGTIASRESGNGLAPSMTSGEMLAYLGDMNPDHHIEHAELLNLDSSNIQPEEWQAMAARIKSALPAYDGILVTHGTDTMAYSAAALSFMLQNLNKSVVLTGAQLPVESPLSDAKTNLYTALAAIEAGIRGVTVAFDRKIINGTRAVKVSTLGFNAFESVNAPCMAEVLADGLRVRARETAPYDPAAPLRYYDRLEKNVFLLKLVPGTNPAIFDALETIGYKGLVLECFGSGGLHVLNRNLLEKIERLTGRGVPVVACSQCLYERCDLSIYDVGQKLLARHVIPARDMTTEAAVVKLMWALGQTDKMERIREVFAASFVGEVAP